MDSIEIYQVQVSLIPIAPPNKQFFQFKYFTDIQEAQNYANTVTSPDALVNSVHIIQHYFGQDGYSASIFD